MAVLPDRVIYDTVSSLSYDPISGTSLQRVLCDTVRAFPLICSITLDTVRDNNRIIIYYCIGYFGVGKRKENRREISIYFIKCIK